MSETSWSGSNGGYSQVFTRPSYQNGVQSNAYRGVPDLAANADPNTGYNVCFSSLYGCVPVGGNITIHLICIE